MLAAVPDALDVDVVSQIPDFVGCVDRVSIICMHYAGVVEHDIDSTKLVLRLDHSLDVGFFANVAFDRRNPRSIWYELFDLGECLCQCRSAYIGHQDRGTFAGEKDCCLETNSAIPNQLTSLKGRRRQRQVIKLWK